MAPSTVPNSVQVQIDLNKLSERWSQVQKMHSFSQPTLRALEKLLKEGVDHDCYRVDPVDFAMTRGLDRAEVIDLFLCATKEGIFEMKWHVICPMCSGLVSSVDRLRGLNSKYHCDICDVDGEANLDDCIQVSFTVTPAIRKIKHHDLASLSPEEYFLEHYFNRCAVMTSSGKRLFECGKDYAKLVAFLPPQGSLSVPFDMPKGMLCAIESETGKSHWTRVLSSPSGGSRKPLTFEFTSQGWAGLPEEALAGPVEAKVENRSAREIKVLLFWVDPDESQHTLSLAPYLTGKVLLNTQRFRELFRWETLQTDEGISIKDISFIFTDLKGSTALYERIGDLKAFALVKRHFESLSRVILRNHGSIVKTIGDAVMAAFLNPKDALTAAGEMLTEIENFNHGLNQRDVLLKIGLHKGAAMMVTLNEQLDYFGQAVNIAARIQNLADADEIWISEEVKSAEGVAEVLGRFKVAPEKAKLKGISDEMRVYKLTHLSGS